MGCRIGRGPDGSVFVEFEHILRFRVDLAARSIACQSLQSERDADTFQHLLLDQLVPRIRAYEGQFVIHAAGVTAKNGALLLVGPSGRGKSTLTASLISDGFGLLGDDAVTLDPVSEPVLAQGLYPSLRLLPDSIAAVLGNDVKSTPTAHYTTKRRIPAVSGVAETPCRAIIKLASPSRSQTITAKPMGAKEVCMMLVQESFALDPSDTAQASSRLAAASKVAASVQGFELHYPREYEYLPRVHEILCESAGLHR